MAANEYKNEEGKTGRLQWFVLVILIPLIFAIMLSLIVATIAGVNVFEAAQKYSSQIPVISSIVSNDQEQENSDAGSPELKAEVEDKKAQIQALQTQLDSKDEKIQSLEQEIADLTDQLAAKNEDKQKQQEVLDMLGNSYEQMDAERAAPIIASLDTNVAISILESLSNEARGSIFEEMNPEQAANLTSAFVQSTSANEVDNQESTDE